ncbi:hypothetical protein M406DRAFT_284346 [Cryphonectria parasitica EP155]|uniref:Uncharacterized protein n=1 Tax=Cryphonectria parasitica (strain ATCC 38755 / EP155) TaxID=660469 RepID=A0A9P4YBJ6_CRYP1|nr:uncharacterized protein M406DRAFT_284346 [Cryphonectria parasitica EP155]KAF3769872.1 hypothetical protein M406DRAFT_284346 [Cryphonectria parasitica EP155]
MSTFLKNGPATRLLCRTCRRAQWQTASFSHGQPPDSNLQWRRHYASKAIRPKSPRPARHSPTASSSSSPSIPIPSSSSPGPRLSARGGPPAAPTTRDPERLIFSARDVPTLPEWTTSLEGLGNGDLTPIQCMEGALRYVSIATQHESAWRGRLERDYNLSPYMLHWIGILLLTANTATRWRLGTHMLRSASEQGYSPSTLTLVRTFRSMPDRIFQERAAGTRLFQSADARFRELLRQGTDPDALTLQGIIEASHGDDLKRALAMFRRATEAYWKAHPPSRPPATPSPPPPHDSSKGLVKQFTLPAPREPLWEWEVSCVLGQADILRRQGEKRAAEELYRVAALELDNPRAFLELARLMSGPRDSPERRAYLLKAAISGEVEACREMGKLERLAAEDKALPERERADHVLMSKEWFRLGEGDYLAAVKAEDLAGAGEA